MLHNEARRLLIDAYKRSHNAKEVAANFSVHPSTVYRLYQQMEKTGSIDTRTYMRGRKPALSKEDIEKIDNIIKNQPDITIREIKNRLSLSVSDETVRKAAIHLGYRYKKKTIHASERSRLRCGRTEKSMGG